MTMNFALTSPSLVLRLLHGLKIGAAGGADIGFSSETHGIQQGWLGRAGEMLGFYGKVMDVGKAVVI